MLTFVFHVVLCCVVPHLPFVVRMCCFILHPFNAKYSYIGVVVAGIFGYVMPVVSDSARFGDHVLTFANVVLLFVGCFASACKVAE